MQWLADACSTLAGLWDTPPAPGTKQHREWNQRVRRELNEERFKPEGQRNPERVRQLRMQELRLGIED